MFRYGILAFPLLIGLWFAVDRALNYQGKIKQIQIDYSSKNSPQVLSLYYSLTEKFERNNFLKAQSNYADDTTSRVILNLTDSDINFLRLDPEFLSHEDTLKIRKILFLTKKDTIVVFPQNRYNFIKEQNDIKLNFSKTVVEIWPESFAAGNDFFFEFVPVAKIWRDYHGGISKFMYFNMILFCAVLFIFFSFSPYSKNYFWNLIALSLLISLFYSRALVISFIISLALLSIALLIKSKRNLIKNYGPFSISLIYVIYLTYMIFSRESEMLVILEHQFSLLLFPLIFSSIVWSKNDFEKVLTSFSKVVALILILVSVSISILLIESDLGFMQLYEDAQFLQASLFTWIDGNLHTSFFCYTIFIGLLIVINKTDQKKNLNFIQSIFYILMFVAASLLIGVRVSILLSAILFLYLTIKRRSYDLFRVNKWILLVLIVCILLVIHVLSYKFIFIQIDPIRYNLWSLAIQLIREHPILGIEYGQFTNFYKTYLLNNDLPISKLYNHPHNQFLFMGLTFGIPFLVAFVLVLCFLMLKAIKLRNEILVFLLTGSFIFMSFDILLNSLKGIVPFTFFISLFLVKNKNQCDENLSRSFVKEIN